MRRNVARGFKDVALYEVGAVFLPGESLGSPSNEPIGVHPSEQTLAGLQAGIPDQPRLVAGAVAGHEAAPGAGFAPRAFDWQDPIAAALAVGRTVGVELTVSQGAHQAFHPGRTATLALPDGTAVGVAGELLPAWLESADMPARTGAFELDLDAVMAASAERVVARPLSTYPASTQDVALVVASDVVAGDVRVTLAEGAGELLEDVALFDVYEGTGVPEGHKSLAFTLRFRAPDRTLTADEASEARAAATALAAERHGAVQR